MSFAHIFFQAVAYHLMILAEVFTFNEVQLTNFFYHGTYFWSYI